MNRISVSILDDNPDFLKLLKIAVEEHFECFATSDTEEFIKHVEQPAVLIIDMYLGNETGLDVMRRIRPKQKLCHVIFISATASKEIIKESHNEGWGGNFWEKDEDDFWGKLIRSITHAKELLRDKIKIVEEVFEISNKIDESLKRLK